MRWLRDLAFFVETSLSQAIRYLGHFATGAITSLRYAIACGQDRMSTNELSWQDIAIAGTGKTTSSSFVDLQAQHVSRQDDYNPTAAEHILLAESRMTHISAHRGEKRIAHPKEDGTAAKHAKKKEFRQDVKKTQHKERGAAKTKQDQAFIMRPKEDSRQDVLDFDKDPPMLNSTGTLLKVGPRTKPKPIPRSEKADIVDQQLETEQTQSELPESDHPEVKPVMPDRFVPNARAAAFQPGSRFHFILRLTTSPDRQDIAEGWQLVDARTTLAKSAAHDFVAQNAEQLKDRPEFAPLRAKYRAMVEYLHHYAPVYLALGRCYHAIPLGARASGALPECSKWTASEAFVATDMAQLPDLIYVFGETTMRLEEAAAELQGESGSAEYADAQLRRGDALLHEAEMRLRILQHVVGDMASLYDLDRANSWMETEDEQRMRNVLEAQWVMRLPQVCAALGVDGGGLHEFKVAYGGARPGQ